VALAVRERPLDGQTRGWDDGHRKTNQPPDQEAAMPHRLLALAAVALLAAPAPGDGPRRVVRESIEWLDVWVPGNEVKGLPRVLLIGDSITRGYHGEVERRLKGKAVVARLTTSKGLGDPGLVAEVALVLSQTRFDVVHFNNGLHGWGYTEGEYARALPGLVDAIRKGAPGAKLVWANTTPVRVSGNPKRLDPKTERVRARNKAAAAYMKRRGIPTDDLFGLAEGHPEWYSADGVHFTARGTAALGAQVAARLLRVLADARR
jgi:lysophospholipase L1-like esterase